MQQTAKMPAACVPAGHLAAATGLAARRVGAPVSQAQGGLREGQLYQARAFVTGYATSIAVAAPGQRSCSGGPSRKPRPGPSLGVRVVQVGIDPAFPVPFLHPHHLAHQGCFAGFVS
jgi:hypothetical protein